MLRDHFITVWILASLTAVLHAEEHWAFQRLSRPDVPEVKNKTWPRDDLDRFVLAAQEAIGMTISPETNTGTIRRRLAFGLTGLPPRAGEMDLKAYADELLASPQFGERWGRHWLDVARYGDSLGYRYDDDIPHSYTYRDWVIRALNEDMPYDQFVQWQIAGDELAPDDKVALAATGFLGVGPRPRIEGNDLNKKEARYIEIDDMVGTTFTGFLGVSMACARCHDHKTDPISQKEYYSIAKAFLSGKRRSQPYLDLKEKRVWQKWNDDDRSWKRSFRQWDKTYRESFAEEVASLRAPLEAERKMIGDEAVAKLEGVEPPKTQEERERRIRQQGARLLGGKKFRRWKALKKEADTLESDLLRDESFLSPLIADEAFSGWKELMAERQQLNASKPSEPEKCLSFHEGRGEPVVSPVMRRGSVAAPLDEVPLVFPAALTGEFVVNVKPAGKSSTGQRRELARWLTDVEQGAGHLLARVMVNRIWEKHFGKGLVSTVDDFGVTGDRPHLAELLDYLACEFIDSGWKIKEMHRRIVNSATYRTSSAEDPGNQERDPINATLWRRPLVRLEGEILRDTMLSVAGKLNLKMHGPGVKLPIPKEVIISRLGKAYPTDIKDGPEVWRRSVYAFHKRTVPVPFFRVFDAPSGSESCGRRIKTTVPTQALTMMNGDFMHLRSRDFAQRLIDECGETAETCLVRAYELALDREPTAEEKVMAVEYLAGAEDFTQGLTDFCQVMFNLNEFIYLR